METVCMIACVILGFAIGNISGFAMAYRRHSEQLAPLIVALQGVVKANREYVEYVECLKSRSTKRKPKETDAK